MMKVELITGANLKPDLVIDNVVRMIVTDDSGVQHSIVSVVGMHIASSQLVMILPDGQGNGISLIPVVEDTG